MNSGQMRRKSCRPVESNDITAGKIISNQINFSSAVIYDANSNIQYPVQTNQRIDYSSEAVKKVWKLEYSDGNCVEAIKEYDKIAKISSIPDEVYECQMGIIRCLSKQNKFGDAIKICREWAYPGKSIINDYRLNKSAEQS